MGNEGAVLFFDRGGDASRTALDTILADLGYVHTTEGQGVELSLWQSASGLCAKIEINKAFALVLARRLARHTKRPLRVFTARLVADDPIECAVDELVVAAHGEPRQGKWGVDLATEVGDDWSELCDGKAYFVVGLTLDHGVRSVLGEEHQRTVSLRLIAPPSLGAPRLDEIAKQVRLADEATLTEVAGRPCVRIRTADATVTSFVSAAEAAVLSGALGALLRTK